MEDWQPCSRILSHILNYMGYCKWMIEARRQCNANMNRLINEKYRNIGFWTLVSGSKGEGLSNEYQSDIDILLFYDFLCKTFETVNGVPSVVIRDPARYMFKVEKDWSPAGYCMLALESRPLELNNMIENCLRPVDKGVVCLDVSNFLRDAADIFSRNQATRLAGPSLAVSDIGHIDNEYVLTFSCPCSAELDAWYKRPRHHDWPSQSLQHDVISTPANVVAVGSKDGIFDKMEWRFCFNQAELKLMGSLNHTQKQVYVVLKMILKDYLKPENKEITSYVMKNIVFWMCESNPVSSFTQSTLLSWIYVGLQTLKDHIESGKLPYYMIPARNLLDGKFLDNTIKTAFLDKLSNLLESGACIVHVCDTIQIGLELYNQGLLEDYGWKRNLVETFRMAKEHRPNNVRDRIECLHLLGIDNPLYRVLLPDLATLLEQGITEDEITTLLNYRGALFLNPDKDDIVAQNCLNVLP